MQKYEILCAMEKELQPYLQEMKNVKVTKTTMLSFHQGTMDDASIVAVYSGVGKVNAAIATQILISKFHGRNS